MVSFCFVMLLQEEASLSYSFSLYNKYGLSSRVGYLFLRHPAPVTTDVDGLSPGFDTEWKFIILRQI